MLGDLAIHLPSGNHQLVATVLFRWGLYSPLLHSLHISSSSPNTQLTSLIWIICLVFVRLEFSVLALECVPRILCSKKVLFGLSNVYSWMWACQRLCLSLQAITDGGLFCCQQLETVPAALLPLLCLQTSAEPALPFTNVVSLGALTSHNLLLVSGSPLPLHTLG